MKLLIIFLCLVPTVISAQKLRQFNDERAQIDKRLMIGLGTRSALNLVVGGVGWVTSDDRELISFHQMNVTWSVVNLGLALPVYFRAKKMGTNFTLAESIAAQNKTEKILLFNAGLDFSYITGGFLLRSLAKNNINRKDQFHGFGSSFIMQGAFSLVFDVTAIFFHRRHANKTINEDLKGLQLSSSGLGLKWGF
jgi:hypothetical protein